MERGQQPIPNRLKFHRRLRGFTQKEAANLLGLSDALSLRQWEKGKFLPGTTNLIKLSLLYRTYPNDLYPEYFKELKNVLDNLEFSRFENQL